MVQYSLIMWWKPPTLPSQSGLPMCSDGLLRGSYGVWILKGLCSMMAIPGRVDTSDASEVIAGAVSAGFCDLIMRTLVP